MDRTVHKRYLDYRARHEYFGRNKPILNAADYERLDAEERELRAKGDERDDEEEERFTDLCFVLLID